MTYEEFIRRELRQWERAMLRPPSLTNRLSKSLQRRLNNLIPEKVHQVITAGIKQMTRAVLFGAEYTTRPPVVGKSLAERDREARRRINFYKKAGAAEGGVTGAGGFWFSLADFPILLGLKLKLLYDLAAIYGYSTNDYRERLYVLHIFQLAFSSQERRRDVFLQMRNWSANNLPDDIHAFDWRTFQQEYRDYIDLAKLAQLIPGIGAVVGLVVNYRLVNQLGRTAMNAYRMRWEEGRSLRFEV
jgi:hypothetical protein